MRELLHAMIDVDREPFVLAAFVDWLRLEWKGEHQKLRFADDSARALEWIKRRYGELTSTAWRVASDDQLRAAVQS
jgi:hypothetical protein